MRVLDLRCVDCDDVLRNAWIEQGDDYPRCGCGGRRAVVWDGSKFPMVDAYSTPQYDDGLGKWVSSTRERERIAREHGLTPCGDPVGGARQVHRLDGRLTFDGRKPAA